MISQAKIQWKAARLEGAVDGEINPSDLTGFWIYMKIQESGDNIELTPLLLGRWIEQMDRFSGEQLCLAMDDFYKE